MRRYTKRERTQAGCYDPVIVDDNRFYAEADIEPAYLELLVGAEFPSRRVRRQLGRRRPFPGAR